MVKYFLKAFKITNENIILTTPFILFLFLFGVYFGVAKNVPAGLVSAILLLLTILFMAGAFFSGWLFMVQKAIDLDKKEFLSDEDKAKASFALMKEIPVGVGEYFLSFTVGLILYFALLALFSFAVYWIGMHFIGGIGLNFLELKEAMSSPAMMKELVLSLSSEQLRRLNAWNFLFLGSMALFSFITMFWAVQIIAKTKNPLIAFFKSIKFLFKNFFSSVVLFIYISVINFVVSLTNALSTLNQILYFVSMILYFYFVVYVIVLVFLYYDSENQAKNNSHSRTDCIGQDQFCNPDIYQE